MRQWMVEPKLMCRKHLLGEHVEHHMFLGTLKKNISVEGYLRDGLLDIVTLHRRHKELVEEMMSRGYKHHSVLEVTDTQLNEYVLKYKHLPPRIDIKGNIDELCRRCPDCRARIEASLSVGSASN